VLKNLTTAGDGMKLLKEFIRNQDINLNGKAIYREAVRGVALRGKTLLMIRSSKDGDLRFPGGGVKPGETHEAALSREIREECGAALLSVQGGLGYVVECGAPVEKDFDVFKMASFYYICEVNSDFGEQSLDRYEEDLGFRPVWADIDEAISTNKALIDAGRHPRWTPRETFVLEYVKEAFGL
jgi:8-oxo-dGTP pyrophosphatase MutT (NUDIX family)